jgi:hypothetical protein
MLRRATFRPSNLPKLALCSWFKGEDLKNQEELDRGNAMDSAYRYMLRPSPKEECTIALSEPDFSNVMWAVSETMDLADGAPIICEKDSCKVIIPGFHNPGEVDAEVPYNLFSTDVKSGQEYDYLLQQSAYAYGEMEKHFADSWTVWMLYMDLRKRVSYRFTRTKATIVVENERERYDNPQEPRINQFCSWCANYEQCPAQLLMAEKAMGHLKPTFNFEELKKDPVKLGEWLTAAYSIAGNSGFYPRGKDAAKEFIVKKTVVPGWTLTSNMHLHKEAK